MKTATEILQDYKRLYDQGALTDPEYSYMKKHLLSMGNRQFEDDKKFKMTSAQNKREAKSNIIMKVVVGIIIAVVVFVVVGCFDFVHNAVDSGPDYNTYYQDENGNGEFDKGEWNWTEDEDGNVVDIDNDGSNF